MTLPVILLAGLAIVYVVLNVRRMRRGRRWAFTVCQVAKEWEERDRARRRALLAAAQDHQAATAEPAGALRRV